LFVFAAAGLAGLREKVVECTRGGSE